MQIINIISLHQKGESDLFKIHSLKNFKIKIMTNQSLLYNDTQIGQNMHDRKPKQKKRKKKKKIFN